MSTLTFLMAMFLKFECGWSFWEIMLAYIAWMIFLFLFIVFYNAAGSLYDWIRGE